MTDDGSQDDTGYVSDAQDTGENDNTGEDDLQDGDNSQGSDDDSDGGDSGTFGDDTDNGMSSEILELEQEANSGGDNSGDDSAGDDGSDDSGNTAASTTPAPGSTTATGSGADGSKYNFSLKIFGTKIDTSKVSLQGAEHIIAKYNPATFLLRDTVGGLLDINLFGLATAMGIEKDKGSSAWNKVINIWDALGGNETDLGNMVQRGRGKTRIAADGTATTGTTAPIPQGDTGLTVSQKAAITAGSASVAGIITAATSGTAAPYAVPAAGVISAVANVLPTDTGLPKPSSKAPAGIDQATWDAMNKQDEGGINKQDEGGISAIIKKNGKYIAIGIGVVLFIIVISSMAGKKKEAA